MKKIFKKNFMAISTIALANLTLTNFAFTQEYVRQKSAYETSLTTEKVALKTFSDVQKMFQDESDPSTFTCATGTPEGDAILNSKSSEIRPEGSTGKGDGTIKSGGGDSSLNDKLLVLAAVNFTNASSEEEVGGIGVIQNQLQYAKDFYLQSSSGLKNYNINFNSSITAYFVNVGMDGVGCGSYYDIVLPKVLEQLAIVQGITQDMIGTLVVGLPSGFSCGNAADYPISCNGYCHVIMQSSRFTEAKAQTLRHELGHTNGVSHAMADLDNDGVADPGGNYGDFSSVMGSGTGDFNGPNYFELGYTSINIIDVPSIDGIYQYEIKRHPYGASDGPTALRINISGNPDRKYWVTIRSNLSYDSDIPSIFVSGAAIHRYNTVPENYDFGNIDPTFLIKNLSHSGQIFKDIPNGVKIKQLDFTPSGSVLVEVTIGDVTACDGQEPLIEFVPIIKNQEEIGSGYFAAGDYNLKVTNRDDPSNCNESKFKLTKVSNDGFDYNASNGGTFTISAGETKLIPFSLGFAGGKPIGDYLVHFTLMDAVSNPIQHPDPSGSVIYRVPDTSLTTPPLPPLNLTAELKFDEIQNCKPYVKLDWQHNPGNSGTITYQIFKNNNLETESLTNTKDVHGLLPGTYEMTVKAMNQNNITSDDSNIVSVTVPNISSCLPNLQSTNFSVVRQTSSSFVRLDFFVQANENESNIQQYKIERQLIVNGDITYNEVQVFSNEFFQTITNDGRKAFRFHDMIEQPTTDPTEYTYRLSAQSVTGFWSTIAVKSALVRPSDWMYPEYTNGNPGVTVDQFWRGPKNLNGQDYIKFQITVNETGWINSYLIEEAQSLNGPWTSILTFESDQFAWGGHSQSGNKQFQVNYFGPTQPAPCYRLSYFTQGSGPNIAYVYPGCQ